MEVDVERFLRAQDKGQYEIALEEIKSGKKQTHWIWFIFPQLKIFGKSQVAQYYGIKNAVEGRAFVSNKVLHDHLVEITNALLSLDTRHPKHILGYPDYKKVKSCMTLFEALAPDEEVFAAVLEKFYHGERDEATLQFLDENKRQHT